MWELDYKQSWVPKNWCFWIVVLEKNLESPLDWKEAQPVNPKRHQSWIFIGRTDVEAETPILWPPDVKNWLIWKDPDSGKDWRREEKGTTEDGWMADSMGMSLSKPRELVLDREAWCAAVHGVAKSQTRLSDWTELNLTCNLHRQSSSLNTHTLYETHCAQSLSCSPPGSSVHGIIQARIMEWVAISYFRGSSQSRDGTLVSCVSCIYRRIYHLYHLWSRIDHT